MITIPGLNPSFVEGFLSSLAATVAWFALYSMSQRLWKIERLSQFVTFEVPPLRKYLIVISWSTVIGYSLYALGALWAGGIFFALGIAIYPLRWLYFASKVGLYRIDQTVERGIDYDRALRLAKNSIDFLGTGAFKLTSSTEFERAIARCNRPDRPIRFLLSEPDNPALKKAAAQAGAPGNTYRDRVEQSLKKLAELKINRHMNIDVRLYRSEAKDISPETFRLMFIDDSICLMSYNIYGRGEGRIFLSGL